MTMKAWLEGHEFDLEDLARLLPTDDVRVIKEGDGFYLTAAELDNPTPGRAFHEVAEELLVRVNGVGRLMRDGFAPVALKGHYEQDGNVSVVLSTATVRLRAHISATATVYDSDGNPVPQPPLASPAYIALAAQNPDVAEVLEIMGRPDPLSFADLYKVYEIIKHSGALNPAMNSAGVSEATTRLFTRTANHPEASGDAARHARSRDQPPARPMTLDEARAMLRSLASAWLDSF
jgi:hypothetical protein